ncbi:Asp-tRNA(Asn)/Glu-tRNA(Gln) amidotransferase subunit GatA [bacterium]|nr:Asp-tRNA(Asn)/Glu-tRNA(Gln) amidotransferase subunit GatA [bacterium]
MIKEIHRKLAQREISVTELVQRYLSTIKDKEEQIKAFITITEQQALEAARKLDSEIQEGKELGILEGIPFAVKDNILTKGIKTTACSKILQNYIGVYDATVIRKLKEAGAIILGKTNMDEFAMGSSTENSAFFPTKNPWDERRVPGGSSGGSAAAVAAQMVPFALGSDTGGSIRQPAAFCGIVGFKPSYGAVSRYGLIALASSLDVIGPLTLSVEDAEIVFRVISGKDDLDSTSYDLRACSLPKEKITVGIPQECFSQGLDSEIKENMEKTIEKLKAAEITIKTISLPLLPYSLACYYIILPAEASANLARYDGIRYSPLDTELEGNDLLSLYYDTRGLGFGSEVRRRIVLGTFVLSRGYYEAFYKRAQKVRKLITEEYKRIFSEVDFIISPTTPTLPFFLGEKKDDPLAMYLSDIFTVSANIAGVPAISIPSGFSKEHLPIGLQITAPYGKDFLLLEFAKKIEKIVAYE